MPKAKGKKRSIECEHCEKTCTVQFTGRAIVQCCPFCGEAVTVLDEDDRPLLNNFEELDDFNESKYYEGDDDDGSED